MAIVGHVSVKFTGNSAGFVDSVRQAIAALTGLNKAFYSAEAAAKIFSQALSTASPSLDAFNKISGNTLSVLKGQSTIINNVASSFAKFGTSLNQIGSGSLTTLNGIATALKNVSQAATHVGQTAPPAINNMNNALNNAGTTMNNVQNRAVSLRSALGGLTAGLTVKTIVAGVADFEHQFNQVAKLLERNDIGKAREEFTKLAGTVPVSTEQLSKLYQAVARIGVAGVDAQISVTKLGTDLTAVMGDGAADAMERMFRFNSVLGEGHEKLRETANVVVSVADALATNETEIIALVSRWGQFGNSIGLSKTQLVAFSGVMRAANINAEAGATAMQKLTAVLDRAGKEGGKELEVLAEMTGKTAKEFADLVKTDPGQALRLFFEASNKVMNSPGGLTELLEKMDVLGLDSERVNRVIQQTAGAIHLLDPALKAANSGMANMNATSDKAIIATQGLQAQWDILKNSLKAVSTVLLTDVVVALTSAIKSLRDSVNAVHDFDTETLKLIKSLGGIAVETAAVGVALYGLITTIKLVGVAFAAMTPVGWSVIIITAVVEVIRHFDQLVKVLENVGIKLRSIGSQAASAQKAVENVRIAQQQQASYDVIIDKVKELKKEEEKLSKWNAGWGSPTEAAAAPKALGAVKDQLKEIREKYKDVPQIQVEVLGLKKLDELQKEFDDTKKKKEDMIAAGEKGFSFGIGGGYATRLKGYDEEMKRLDDAMVLRKKYDAMKAAPEPTTPVQSEKWGAEPVTPKVAAPAVAKTTGVAPPTESQKIITELQKSLDIIEKKFKATGDEEERLKERSKLLKKALDEVAVTTDALSNKSLMEVGAQLRANEANLDKYTNVTKKALKATGDFATNVSALDQRKKLLGTTTESVQEELSLYESRLKELTRTQGASQEEIGKVTTKIKELQAALEQSKSVDAQKKIMETLDAAMAAASINTGTYAEKVGALQQRVSALNTAYKEMVKLLGEVDPKVQALKDRVAATEAELAEAKGQQKYQEGMEKIRLKNLEAEETFGALGDIQTYLKSQVDTATDSLLLMYKTFGEGTPEVLQARDDLISAANAVDIFTSGQTKYRAIMDDLDKNAKKEEKVWKKLGETLKSVGEEVGEALSGMVEGTKTAKEGMTEILKALLKEIIKFVIQAVAQFIILSIVGGGGGVGQRIGQSISAGLTGNISMTPTAKAQGGVLTRPTVTKLAERGPEAVIPLQNGSVPVMVQGGMGGGIGGISTGDIDHPFEVTIINVVEKSKADSIAKDRKAIINIINEDIEARGSTFRNVKGLAKTR